jgi:hypothetical protein
MPREPPVMRTERAIAQRPPADLARSAAEAFKFSSPDRLGRDRIREIGASSQAGGRQIQIGAFSAL